MHQLLANPYIAGAISGAVAGALADISAFRSWKSFHEAATYDWATAAWRWFQGAAGGVIAAAGIGLTA